MKDDRYHDSSDLSKKISPLTLPYHPLFDHYRFPDHEIWYIGMRFVLRISERKL